MRSPGPLGAMGCVGSVGRRMVETDGSDDALDVGEREHGAGRRQQRLLLVMSSGSSGHTPSDGPPDALGDIDQ